MSDPNMHYDGTRWLRWDGTQWLDAASGAPAGGAPVPPANKSKLALWLVMGGIGVVLVVGVIGIAASGGSKPTATASSTPTVAASPTTAPVTPAPVDPTPEAPAGPMTVIEEGDWVVGEDIAPGTYKTATTVNGFCYWGIYKAGSNKSNIIDNGVATGGRPSVTLKKGQEFTNQGCGTFVKK